MSAWKVFVACGLILAAIAGIEIYQNWEAKQNFEDDRYNGFDFWQSNDGLWVTRLVSGDTQYDMKFHHHPRETEGVLRDINTSDLFFNHQAQHVWISIDPDAGSRPVIGGVEISRITGERYNLLNIPTSSALSRELEGVEIPVVSCDQANINHTVIQFVEDLEGENAIVRDGYCLVLFYKSANESIIVADRLAYLMLRIMP